MYELIFWLCLASNPQCDRYHSVGHQYHTLYGTPSHKDCEEAWTTLDAREPDPPGTKSSHICQAISEPL